MFFNSVEEEEKIENHFRRVVTASLHPGKVYTNIGNESVFLQPFQRSKEEVVGTAATLKACQLTNTS